MGRRGPRPQPAAIRKAKGNPGHRPIGEDPVVDESALAEIGEAEAAATDAQPAASDRPALSVEAPEWISEAGRKVWDRLAPRLVQLKLLTRTDAETFGRYCQNFARWLKMQTRLDELGEVYEIETASGLVRRADPAYMIADRLEKQLTTAEANFGLNPAERQRLFAARAAGASAGLGDLFGDRAGQSQAPAAKPESVAVQPSPAKPRRSVGYLQ